VGYRGCCTTIQSAKSISPHLVPDQLIVHDVVRCRCCTQSVVPSTCSSFQLVGRARRLTVGGRYAFVFAGASSCGEICVATGVRTASIEAHCGAICARVRGWFHQVTFADGASGAGIDSLNTAIGIITTDNHASQVGLRGLSIRLRTICEARWTAATW